ncbi:hypothetical protein, partial [Thiolapillus sp.]|uniref:hypothetical protein n=2 Tax=Thiolapillus sp. TaxID=2017437 RepID=UPI0025FD3307
MTRTAGAPMGCQRPSRFWGLGCPKIYHEAEDTLVPSTNVARVSSGKIFRGEPRDVTPKVQGIFGRRRAATNDC